MRNIRVLTMLAGLALVVGPPPCCVSRLSAQPPAAPMPAPATEAAAAPHPGEHVTRIASPQSQLTITELQSRVVELEARIRLVDDFNPQTVTVTALSPTQLRIRGESPGVTTVRIADEFDNVYRVEVMVERDLRELEANLRRLFPGSAVSVVGVRDSIVLQGWVTQPQQIPQIVQLAQTYTPQVLNHLQVGGGSQVQLSCKVLEVQRSKLEQLGFNFLALGQNYYFASTPGNIASVGSATLPFGGPPTITTTAASLTNSTLQFAVLGSSDIFRGFIDALKQESLLKILAEPTLITTSGRPADIHSGGEFPILVPQGVGTATIQFREYGIRLEAVPIVLGNGRVQLDIAAEVSDRDFSNSVDVGGVRVPGITSRDVNTRVEMNFGETFMLGGLTQDRVTVSTNKVPVLGDVPYLGLAFSRKNQQIATTELIILITPHLTAPMAPGQVPCNLPGMNSDRTTCKELFVDGHVEVPNYGNANPCPPGLIGPGGCPTPGGAPAWDGAVVPGYGEVPAYGPAMEYVPESGLVPGQPMMDPGLAPGAGEPIGPAPALPLETPPAAASARRPTGGRGMPMASHAAMQGIRTVGAEDADLAPARLSTAGSPGLIEPSRTYTRSAPQYVGRSNQSP